MSRLIDNLQNKIETNTNALSYVQQEKPKTQADIDLFGPTLVQVDSNIVTLVAEINSLKTQIVSLSLNAYNVGCGTTVAATTVFPDRVVAKTPNYYTSSYDGNDPYGNTDNTLSASNVGVGSFLVYNQGDTSQAGIGTLFANTSTCYRNLIIPPLCNSAVCVSHASSITALQNRIVTLQAQVSNLIPKSNAVKGERSEYELARYGYNQTTRILTERNTQIGIAINCIKDLSPNT